MTLLTSQNEQNIEITIIEPSDMELFKKVLLIFILSTLGSIVVGFINILFSDLFQIISFGSLGFGTYYLGRKYSQFSSGLRVSLLFFCMITVILVTNIIDYLFPTPGYSGQKTQAEVNAIIQKFHQNLIVIVPLMIITVIIAFSSAYYFSNWFNIAFGQMNPIKSFLYYGILYSLGSIVTTLGYISLMDGLKSVDFTNDTTIKNTISNISTQLFITAIGGIMILLAEIFLIVAGFKMYNRLKDLVIQKE